MRRNQVVILFTLADNGPGRQITVQIFRSAIAQLAAFDLARLQVGINRRNGVIYPQLS